MNSLVGRIVAAAGLVLGLTIGTPAAKAAIVAVDDPVFGSNSLVLDTNSGLQWLAFPSVPKVPLEQLYEALLPGGELADLLRWGRQTEICPLLQSASFNCLGIHRGDTAVAARARFIELFGGTQGVADPDPPNPGNPAGREIYSFRIFPVVECLVGQPGQPGAFAPCFETDAQFAPFNFFAPNPVNAFLVRVTAAVPEPGSLALLIVGSAGLGLLGKRRL